MPSYKLGRTYTDKAASTNPEDEFLRWINIPGSAMGNSEGIRSLNYVGKDSLSLPANMILVSHEVKRKGNPWQDSVDFSTATVYYWGDAKFHPKKQYGDFKGNKRLLQIWHAVLDNELVKVPPILHFSKPEVGKVSFSGLCILKKLDLSWFEERSHPVKNYRAELSILDCAEVDIEWLHDRANNTDITKLVKSTPKIWKDYVKGKTRKMDIFKKDILNRNEQMPGEHSDGASILKQLHGLTSEEFEAVVVYLFENLPASHKIIRTRPMKDGGFDFYGNFALPYPTHYRINCLGEVKKYSRTNPVQPKDVSRLVARLGRGEYGIFVTLSYYTPQAQREVLEDGYPVRLFNGNDVINILQELRLINKDQIKKGWLETIKASIK